MILSGKKICLFVLAGCLLTFSSRAQENLMDFDNSLKFARYLKSTQQFRFASEEYERLNFLWPGNTSVILELVQTYRFNKQCDKLEDSFILLKRNLFLMDSSNAAREYLSFALTCRSDSEKFFEFTSLLKPGERCFYELGHFWVTQKYDSAFNYTRSNEDLIKAEHNYLYQLTYDFEQEKYKSPALGLVMSALVPGSGKLYSKRTGDALISFLFVSTNAYASYRAFNRKGIKSVNGWIFGGIAFSFYSANLYGSAKAAKRYNNDLRTRYQNNAENYIYTSF
jgi:TM2 domain-containing membrane protein YozV